MKKQFTELIGVLSTLVFLILLTPTNLSAQCEAGEAEYTLSVYTAGAFVDERGVEVVPGNGDPAFFLINCGSYPANQFPAVYVDFNFCAVIGEDYTLNFLDTFGDGWNMASDPAPWVLSNGPVEIASGNPNNGGAGGACGSAGSIDDSFTFTAAPPPNCEVPDVEYTVTEDCETNTYDAQITLNDFGADDNGLPIFNLTVFLTTEDDYEITDPQQTYPNFLLGQTVDLILDVPFGVTITATPVVGIESICNQGTDLTNANVCPPPNDECSEAIEIFCDETVSGNTQNAAAPPQGAVDVATACAQQGSTTLSTGGAWYVWTAPFNAIVDANTCGSSYDTKLHAFQTDDCEVFSCVAGNDDSFFPGPTCPSSGLHSRVIFNVNAGETIYFYVTGFGTNAGDYNFNVSCTELLCSNPTIVFEAQDLDGNPLGDCQEVGAQYQLAVTLTDVPEDDPNLDYTVTAGGLTEAAAVVDQEFILGPYNAGTNVNINVVGNQDDLCTASEAYTSEICPPENNLPCDAIEIFCEGTYFGTNLGADPAPAGEFCDFSSLSGIVYYKFTNPEDNNLIFRWNTCNEGTNFDTDSHLFDGPCDALSCRPTTAQTGGFGGSVGYVDGQLNLGNGFSSPSCADASSTWATGGEVILGPGEMVFLGIDGFSTLQGVFELTVECESILCSSPVVVATAVEVGTSTEIIECQEVGEEYEVQVVINGGTGNTDYTLTVGGAAPVVDALNDGTVYTFGPFPAGSNQVVSATGNDDANCSDDTNAGTTICAPDNNTPCTATVVECGQTYLGTNIGADPAPAGEFCDFSSASGIVYYEWTNPSEGDVLFSWNTCNPGTDFDTDSHFFDGPCDALSCRPVSGQTTAGGYVDGQLNPLTGGSSPSCDNAGSVWATGGEAVVGAGETVYVGIDGFSTLQGVFEVVFNCQDLECSPEAEGLVVADAEGNPVVDCVPQEGEYYVQVTLTGGSDQDYAISVNGSDPVIVGFEGSAIVGPVPALATASILVQGVDNELCSATLSVVADPLCGPANDNICDALPIAADGSVGIYSTAFATTEEGEPIAPAGTSNFSNSCQSNDGWCSFQLNLLNTVWFESVVPESGRVRISTCGPDTDFDTQIAVYQGDCNDFSSLVLLGANDDQPGGCPDFFSASTLEFCAEPGSTILIQIDAGDTFGGDIFNLSVEEVEDNSACLCVAPELDDEFLTFTLLEPTLDCSDPENGFYTMTVNAQPDLGSSDGWDISYTINGGPAMTAFVPAGGSIELPDEIPLGGNIQVTFAFSDPNCVGAIPPFPVTIGGVFFFPGDCAPDCEGTPGGPAQPGSACTTDNEEPGVWDADCVCQASPVNDLCENAIALTCGETVTGSTIAANADIAECAPYTSAPGVWYSFTSEVSGTISLETCLDETDFDTDLSVYTGTCDALTCNPDFGGGGFVDGPFTCSFQSGGPTANFEAEAGVTYYILLTGWFGQTGNFGLSISCELAEEASIEGSVNWNSECGDRDGTLSIYEAGTSNLLNSYPVTVDANGNFSAAIAETGSVDVLVKVDGYLAKASYGEELGVGSNAIDFGAITPGDASGDNEVGIEDFSALSSSYGFADGDASFNPLTDWNCDGETGIEDFSTLSSNYGEVGDEPQE